ncbi:MAG: cysteine-rich CWC family protein [Betaproteobacteria bacterium]|nr:cysteine-rich CWC family protein [Betaproteobacteria bacterium]
MPAAVDTGGLLETQKTCPRCGAGFGCGMNAAGQPCWCAGLPPLVTILPTVGCYCPACLRQLIEAQQVSAAPS